MSYRRDAERRQSDGPRAWMPSGRAFAVVATVAGLMSAIVAPAAVAKPKSKKVTARAAAEAGQVTLFGSTVPATPSFGDATATEIGVVFRSSQAGYVTGVRFYKGSANTGTHTGTLWSAAGSKLARTTFTGETATGWQTAKFSSAVVVKANSTYIVSYHAPRGRYAAKAGDFARDKVSSPLTATSSRYLYTSKSSFPTKTFNETNYYVDLIYVPTLPPIPPITTPTPTPVATPAPTQVPTPAPTPEPTPTAAPNVAAEAIWTAPSNAVVGKPATLDGCASKGTPALRYEWSWGAYSSDVWSTNCQASYTFTTAGDKSVALRVTDADGETSYVAKSFTVSAAPAPTATATATPTPTATATASPGDTAAPNTAIDSGPTGTVTTGSAAFGFSSTESGSTFRCRIDGGAWSGCTSPKSYAALVNGAHTFEVAATDAAGNVDLSPASRTWTVNASSSPSGNNCMADPSVCGYPDVETTGVTPGTTLTKVSGSVTLSTAGQVYENKLLTGSITIAAPNVTIRNVKLVATDPYYAIRAFGWEKNVSGAVIDHVEIDLNGYYDIKGIAFDGYTAKNVFFHNGSDCAHMGGNVTIQDSLCVSGPDVNGDAWPDNSTFCNGPEHFDGLQSDGGSNITIRHNTIRNPCSQTSAILMSSNTSSISNVTIQDNLLAGGGYTLYCNAGPDVANETVTGNRFAKTYFAKGGYWGHQTGCGSADVFSGNIWDETGTAAL
jgi:hypothetical protein